MSDRISHQRRHRQAGRNESGLSCSFLATTTKKTPDRLMGDAILSGNLAQGFVLLTDVTHHVWPFFRWDAMLRHMWTWMLLYGDDRGKTAKQLLECKHSEIELAVRGKEVN